MNRTIGTVPEPAAILAEGTAQRVCTGDRRCRRCNAKLRSGNRLDMCRPCQSAIHRRPGETDCEKRSGCAAFLTTARPKDLVVFADPADKRPTCAIVAECELEDWQYEEPPYGEKLRIGFKMIAGEPVQL